MRKLIDRLAPGAPNWLPPVLIALAVIVVGGLGATIVIATGLLSGRLNWVLVALFVAALVAGAYFASAKLATPSSTPTSSSGRPKVEDPTEEIPVIKMQEIAYGWVPPGPPVSELPASAPAAQPSRTHAEPEEATETIATRRVKASLFAPTLALAVAIAGTVLVAALNNPTYGLYALALCVAYGLREVAPLLVRFSYWATNLVNHIAQAFGKGKQGRTILWLKGIGTFIIVAVVIVLARDFLGAIAPMVFGWITEIARSVYEFLAWILTDLTRTMAAVSVITSMRLVWRWIDWSRRWTILSDEALTLEWGILQRQSISMPRKGMVPDERHIPGAWWCLAKADSPAQDDAAFDRLPWMPRKFWKEVTN